MLVSFLIWGPYDHLHSFQEKGGSNRTPQETANSAEKNKPRKKGPLFPKEDEWAAVMCSSESRPWTVGMLSLRQFAAPDGTQKNAQHFSGEMLVVACD